jgi:hypothetical protein
MVKAGLPKTRTGCIGCRLRRKKGDARSDDFSASTPVAATRAESPFIQTSSPVEISDQYVTLIVHPQALFPFQHNLLRDAKSRILFDH